MLKVVAKLASGSFVTGPVNTDNFGEAAKVTHERAVKEGHRIVSMTIKTLEVSGGLKIVEARKRAPKATAAPAVPVPTGTRKGGR